jgi:beta-lactam-binding protein with PASTA domain
VRVSPFRRGPVRAGETRPGVCERKEVKIKSVAMTLLMIVGVFVFAFVLGNFVIMPLLIHQRGTVLVPDVRQMSEEQAEKFLRRAALTMHVERRDHDAETPEGFVVSQRPRPDESVKEGRTVSVVVSRGTRTLRVPDLKGQSLRQGQLTLGGQRLRAGRVARVLEESEDRERIIACSPVSGTEVVENGTVDILVGVGGRPRQYMMPSLVGQDLLFVKDRLEKRGFRVSQVRYESRKDSYPNTIIDQFPKSGALIREGDSIELVAAGSD